MIDPAFWYGVAAVGALLLLAGVGMAIRNTWHEREGRIRSSRDSWRQIALDQADER